MCKVHPCLTSCTAQSDLAGISIKLGLLRALMLAMLTYCFAILTEAMLTLALHMLTFVLMLK